MQLKRFRTTLNELQISIEEQKNVKRTENNFIDKNIRVDFNSFNRNNKISFPIIEKVFQCITDYSFVIKSYPPPNARIVLE